MAIANSIPVSFLRECFTYDPASGLMRWKARPREHFPDNRAYKIWNTKYANHKCGSVNHHGYRAINLIYHGKRYRFFRHRVAWTLTTGAWPQNEIDHRDGDTSNDCLANLREATRTQNMQNIRDVRGVSRKRKRWAAEIRIGQSKRIRLGTFDTEEEAHRAYLEAKRRHHPFSQ